MTGQTIYIEFEQGTAHQVDRLNTNPSYDLSLEYARAAADPLWQADQLDFVHLAEAQNDITDD